MPSTTNGPNVTPSLITQTQLLRATDLNASPPLPPLFTLINHCFKITHNPPGPSYLPYAPTTRLKRPTQLPEEIGPDGFTIIMAVSKGTSQNDSANTSNDKYPGNGESVVATASARPYTPPQPFNGSKEGKCSESLFKRQPGNDVALAPYAHLPKWEILAMVVEPSLQGRGIAGELMGMAVEEIRQRVRSTPGNGSQGKVEENRLRNGEQSGDRHGDSGGEILLMLSTLQELNEPYYAKRGWQTTSVRRFPVGTMGSRDGFGIVEMMKLIKL